MGPAKKKQRLSNGAAAAAVDSAPEDRAQRRLPTKENLTTAAVDAPADEKEAAVQQRRSLFVRQLPSNTTSESLTELFSETFPVKHATAVTDPATKECRGYGFVTFADAEDAAQAKSQFHGHIIDGKKLRVEIAEPRKRVADADGDMPKKVEHNASKKPDEPVQPTKLIVRNLPWSIKRGDQLEKLFLSFGKVKKAYIPKKGPGLMAGFGFVLMRGKKNAEKAIEGVNGKEIDGRTLAVDWAVEKDTYEDLVKGEKAEEEVSNEEDIDEDIDAAEEEMVDNDEEIESDDASSDGGAELDSEGDEAEDESNLRKPDDRSSTLFIRNLPFTCTDEDLEDHFAQFGNTRYARVVMDYGTERSKGTGFVCFYNKDDADACVREAPARQLPQAQEKGKDGKPVLNPHSILQNDDADPTGRYTLDGRVLQVTKAVEKSEANRLTEEGTVHRTKRDMDKRRLYLLAEGTIQSNSKLYEKLSPSEKAMREGSAKQRKTLIESNPSLHLSLTRLSVRNIPRSIGSKELKALARDAVVGFASDVKAGSRQRLSKEELSRGGEEMREAELARKKSGKGIVRQAKVVFESAGGTKVSEEAGAGRSRGYGFIEYYTHRNALMGLRWLNGHAVGYQVQEAKGKQSREDVSERKKRLIVEFAIENAQVVLRRKEGEQKARARSLAVTQSIAENEAEGGPKGAKGGKGGKGAKAPNWKDVKGKPGSRKRKREDAVRTPTSATSRSEKSKPESKQPADEKLARRNQIIGRKRAMRKNRKGGK
ncbi:ribosome biogenesis protein Nop4 [Zymoseptoria brevis]|uniref:Ribosome biogenesis protein Nop4 n=1 Tax=Zymoseptoria brevis TaxID=1047168 RepID=A0A0F4GYA0_9PEZI|nr:ribosome biogenesis protein Nop4 [Zymoseptoria brevis]